MQASGGAMDVDMGRSGGFSTPQSSRRGRAMGELSSQRRRKHSDDGTFRFTVVPDEALSLSARTPRTPRTPARSSLASTPQMLESPARYSPGKVKEAVRTFADFLRFLEQQENRSESPLMPTIIQRFSELGAVIESQKRHIDHWKQKELDLAIAEAHSSKDMMEQLGITIEQQDTQLAECQAEKVKWEEKFNLAAQELEELKRVGGRQIQHLQAENEELKRRGTIVEETLNERAALIAAMENEHTKLKEHLNKLDQEYTNVHQENQSLRHQREDQAGLIASLENQIRGLQRECEIEKTRSSELEQAVATWKARYEEKESQGKRLEQALDEGRREIGERDGNLNQLMDEAQQYKAHLNDMGKQYEDELTQMQDFVQNAEVEIEALRDELARASEKCEALEKDAAAKQSKLDSAAATIKSMEEKFGQQKSQWEGAVQQDFDQMKLQNQHLSSKLREVEGHNSTISAEISTLKANLREAERQFQHQGRESEQLKQRNAGLTAQLQELEQTAERQAAEINRLTTGLRNAEQQFQGQQMQIETEQVQQLKRELEALHKEGDRLTRVMAQQNAAHAEQIEALKKEYDAKHSEFVTRVETQFKQLSDDNDQLRGALDEEKKKAQGDFNQVVAEKEEEISKLIAECDQLEAKLTEFDHENESLRQELDQCLQELELKRKENAEMSEQIEQYLSPNSERSKEVELLHSERLRLEEQNHELQQQLALTRQDADVKLDEAHQIQLRASELESSHRHTVRSLCLEKEEMNRKLLALGSERSSMEFQLNALAMEKNNLLENSNRLEQEKRALEARLDELMRQVTREIESQQQDVLAQLQFKTNQLAQREEQLRQSHQQIQSLEREVSALREKCQQLEDTERAMRAEGMQLSAKLESALKEKLELEAIVTRQNTTANSLPSQQAVEAEFSRKLDDLKLEADRRIQDEKEFVKRELSAVTSKLEDQEKTFREKTNVLEQERTTLLQEVDILTHTCERLEGELEALKIDRENQENVIQELEQMVDQLEEKRKSTSADVSSNTSTANAAAVKAHRELQVMHEQFKKDIMAQLKEKADIVAELEDDNAELQAKLDRQKEMTRHLMDRSHADKQGHSSELLDQSKTLRDQQERAATLEKQVKELEREIQIKEEARAAKDQGMMHEKLQLEREVRSIKRQLDGAKQENADVRYELEQKTAEIEGLHREIEQNTAEMDVARNALGAAEQQLNRKLEEFSEDLDDREHALYQKEAELEQVRDNARQVEARLNRQIDDQRSELNDLKRQLSELQRELEHAQRPRSANQSTSTLERQESRVRTLQTRCEELEAREQALSDLVAQLEDDKAATLNRFTRELRRLDVDIGPKAGIDISAPLDEALGEYLTEVSELIRSYQDREDRQDALIHRKEQQISELKSQLEKASMSSKPKSEQVDAVDNKAASMRLGTRNGGQRERRTDGTNTQSTSGRDLESKYDQLKTRMQDLKAENARLKQNRLTKADARTFVNEIEKLTTEVMEKDMQLEALRRREAKLRASSASNPSGSGAAPSPGSRDLRALLRQKEEKIMVLNDHLTELMKQSVRLQHENERYVVRFGALEGDGTRQSPTTASSQTTAASDASHRHRRSVRA